MYKIYNDLLTGKTESEAVARANGLDWIEVEANWQELPSYCNEIGTYNGVTVYHCYGTDSHLFVDSTAINYKQELMDSGKLAMFEIEVEDTREAENEYLTFKITTDNIILKAIHVGLTQEKESSPYVDYTKIEIDCDFSLDENLESLLTTIHAAIEYGDLYRIV